MHGVVAVVRPPASSSPRVFVRLSAVSPAGIDAPSRKDSAVDCRVFAVARKWPHPAWPWHWTSVFASPIARQTGTYKNTLPRALRTPQSTRDASARRRRRLPAVSPRWTPSLGLLLLVVPIQHDRASTPASIRVAAPHPHEEPIRSCRECLCIFACVASNQKQLPSALILRNEKPPPPRLATSRKGPRETTYCLLAQQTNKQRHQLPLRLHPRALLNQHPPGYRQPVD